AAQADDVLIIHKGKKAAQGDPRQLKAQFSQDRMLITKKDGQVLSWETGNTQKAIEYLYENRDEIAFFESQRGSMDEVFLNAVGEKLQEGEE
ncbi:MAG: hypothetical protein FWG82_06275, partial [Oscillospiraceae bacterium]|nr:hypothetical protein [Oscillospiraceae bacterium]